MSIVHQKVEGKEAKRLPRPMCAASHHARMVVAMSGKAKYTVTCIGWEGTATLREAHGDTLGINSH